MYKCRWHGDVENIMILPLREERKLMRFIIPNYRVFLFLLFRQALSQRSIEFLLDFLKVIITAVFGLAPVIDC